VTALGPRRKREFFDVARSIMGTRRDPALVMAAAVATYLAYRRDELDDDPDEILRLAARAEFGRHIPQDVDDWLAARGVRAHREET
jgi:predicted transcriptional regulator